MDVTATTYRWTVMLGFSLLMAPRVGAEGEAGRQTQKYRRGRFKPVQYVRKSDGNATFPK